MTNSGVIVSIFRPNKGIFNDSQLAEILSSLETKCEIPKKYSYFDTGVDNWAVRSINSEEELTLYTETKCDQITFAQTPDYQMLYALLNLFLGVGADGYTVNVVDVGCGTGYPVLPILTFLNERDRFGKYIAIDISPGMTDIAVNNLKQTGRLETTKFEQYVHDFEENHFADLILKETNKELNVFLFMGSILSNMRDGSRVLANIRNSMNTGDLLWIGTPLSITSQKLIESYKALKPNSPEYLRRCASLVSFLECCGMTDWFDYGKVVVQESEQAGILNYNFVIDKPFILEFPVPASKESIQLSYKTADQINLMTLTTYHEAELIDELKEAGFKLKMMNVSDDGDTALVLVSV